MRTAHALLAAVALAAALGGAWWVQNQSDVASLLGRSGAVDPAAGVSAGAAASGARSDGAKAGGPGGRAGPGGRNAQGGVGGPGATGGPALVEVGKVERVRLEDDALAVGSLRSKQGVMLRPEVSGRIAALAFDDGQRVRRGQLLVKLDDTLQQAQLRQAQAQASIAATQLQRSRDLVAQNFISQNAVDQNAAALEVAQAQVALAQAQLARMNINAPFDGVTGIRVVNVGDYVKDGADLVSVEDNSSVWVDFRLPERYLPRVRTGQPVEVTLDAMPDRRLVASIGALDSLVDANGRSVLVRARLANADGALRGGMFARARVVFAIRENALMIPEAALVPQGAKQFIVKVVDGPGGGKLAQRIEARIGHRLPGKVELMSGVAEGDVVVIAGHARLMRGEAQPVRIVDIGAKPDGIAASARSASAAGRGASRPDGARSAAPV